MSCIAHISDLHFGRLNEQIAEVLLIELNTRGPELVVISGDFTQRAQPEEFRAARRYVDLLEPPTLCIPGNHDVPSYNLLERFLTPYRRYQHYFGPELCPWIEGTEFAILGVNTARSYSLSRDWSRGRINRDQMRRIETCFANVEAKKIRIVVTHHPFLLPEGDLKRGLVGRWRDALQRMSHVGVDLLLAGHLHKTFSGHVETGQQVIQKILVAQVSTSTSTRLKGDVNAYNWIELDGGCIRLTRHWWNDKTGSFHADEHREYDVVRTADPDQREVQPR